MRRSLCGHIVFGKRAAAQSPHRKRIGSAPKRNSAVNGRIATKWCGRATSGYGRTAARRKRGVPHPFQIIRDSFDLPFVRRDEASNGNCWQHSLGSRARRRRLDGVGRVLSLIQDKDENQSDQQHSPINRKRRISHVRNKRSSCHL